MNGITDANYGVPVGNEWPDANDGVPVGNMRLAVFADANYGDPAGNERYRGRQLWRPCGE